MTRKSHIPHGTFHMSFLGVNGEYSSATLPPLQPSGLSGRSAFQHLRKQSVQEDSCQSIIRSRLTGDLLSNFHTPICHLCLMQQHYNCSFEAIWQDFIFQEIQTIVQDPRIKNKYSIQVVIWVNPSDFRWVNAYHMEDCSFVFFFLDYPCPTPSRDWIIYRTNSAL